MESIKKYFPNLSERQIEQFAALYDLYYDWNSKINVISRKDIENLYEHHVLHSLAIAKYITFKPGTKGAELVPELKIISDHFFVKLFDKNIIFY